MTLLSILEDLGNFGYFMGVEPCLVEGKYTKTRGLDIAGRGAPRRASPVATREITKDVRWRRRKPRGTVVRVSGTTM